MIAILLLGLFAGSIVSAAPASACKFRTHDSFFHDTIDKADVIFRGRIVRFEPWSDYSVVAHFQTGETYKGERRSQWAVTRGELSIAQFQKLHGSDTTIGLVLARQGDVHSVAGSHCYRKLIVDTWATDDPINRALYARGMAPRSVKASLLAVFAGVLAVLFAVSGYVRYRFRAARAEIASDSRRFRSP